MAVYQAGIIDGPVNQTGTKPTPTLPALPTVPTAPTSTLKEGWQAGPGGGNMVQNIATGQVVDTNHPVYTNYQPPAGQTSSTQASSSPGGPITTQQQVGNTTAPVGGTIAQGAPTTIAQSFQQALVNRLNQQPMSASSPEVAPAIQANQLSEQRGMEQSRSLAAERAAAQGLDQNAFNSSLNGLQQQSASRQSQFAGNAVMQGMQERGINDRAAMASAAGLLGGNANLSQQQMLAELDAAIRREGIGAQSALGQGDLALRGRLGEGQLNLGLLSTLLGNQQFGRGLDQQGAQFGAGLDQQGLLGLLGLL
jgi:hypothetical protein